MKGIKKSIFVALLATIIILAVILIVTSLKTSNMTRKDAKRSFEDSTKLLIEAVEDKKEVDHRFDPTIINSNNITSILNISNSNYSDISIVERENTSYISVVGAGEWADFVACGTYNDLKIVEKQSGKCDMDLTPPSLTILGDSLISISTREKYIDQGATAIDNIDGDITNEISVSNNINYTVPGVYSIIYNVTDKAGNKASSIRTVNVFDETSPKISFKTNGSNVYTKTGSTIVTVSDNVSVNKDSLKYLWSTSVVAPKETSFNDSFINNDVIGTPVDVTGSYYLWILAKDNAGNMAITRTNSFDLDNTSPTIGFKTDGNSIYSKTRSTIVTVSDTYSGIDENSLKYLWSTSIVAPKEANFNNSFKNNDVIDTPVGVTGTYYLWILAKDNANNITITRTNLFNLDNTKPFITLIGNSNIILTLGTTYKDAGIMATDNIEGVISVITTGTVNSNVVGVYTITYSAVDNCGNTANSVTRTVTVVDPSAPTVVFKNNGNITYAKTRSTIVTVSDAHSGVNTSSLKYLWSTSITTPEEASFISSFTNGSVINTPTGITGSYYLWILAKDNFGNTIITRTNIFNLDNISPVITLIGRDNINIDRGSIYSDLGSIATDNIDGIIPVTTIGTINPNVIGTYTITYNTTDNSGNAAISMTRTINVVDLSYVVEKGVNKPKLSTGMIPIKWNGITWIDTTENDEEWYNYTAVDKQWANARTADGSMWVWIPRYIYRIPTANWHTFTAGTIDIQFTKGIDDNWNNAVINNITLDPSANSSNGAWTNHPIFTFGDVELTGIWIAKFEASGSTLAVDSKPNVTSLRGITIGNMFTATRNMETNNRYGWGISGNGIDTHLMKNSEWGAVSYLAESIYGKNAKIWLNNSNTYTTGCAGDSASELSYAGCKNQYDTLNGRQASTTGNIYGIYDMSGGAWEYVSAYINNNHSSLNNGATVIEADNKYKDIYDRGEPDNGAKNYELSINKKGDAIYETSVIVSGFVSWNETACNMPKYDQPFFIRGGMHSSGTGGDTFTFYVSAGNSDSSRGFRVVLVVDESL